MTNSDHIGPLGAHGECWNLLPWIANESAEAKDVARVEAHLGECRECQEELEFQRQLRNAIRAEEAIVLERGTVVHRTRSQELLRDPATLDRLIGLQVSDARGHAAAAGRIARPRLI